jgi:hypothetical protein
LWYISISFVDQRSSHGGRLCAVQQVRSAYDMILVAFSWHVLHRVGLQLHLIFYPTTSSEINLAVEIAATPVG